MTAAIPAEPPHPFATLIPDRAPKFKTHRGVGQAKNAIISKLYGGRARHDMVIYKLADGEYQPWVTITAGQTRADVPELAPPPKPKAQLKWEIQGLIEREQRYLKQAEAVAAEHRELEAQR